MKNWIEKNIKGLVIAIVVVCAIGAVSISSLAIDDNVIQLAGNQGTVSAKEVSLNTKIPGRIVEFYVAEGDDVQAGDPIVKISSEELEAKKKQLEAQVSQAKAGVTAAQAVVEIAESNYQLALNRVEQAEAGLEASKSQRDMAGAVNEKATNGARSQQVAQAEAAYKLWQSTVERATALYEGGALSLQKYEELKTQLIIAEETLSLAREGARAEDKLAASSQLSMAEAGVSASEAVLNQAIEAANIAMSQINQAQAGLVAAQGLQAQAEAGLMEVEVYLKDTMILAPIDGTITALDSDEGELVSTGTAIGSVCNLDECWISVNMDENELAGISEGQAVKVSLLAYDGEIFNGEIASINKQPDFAIKKATNDNGNFDIVSFGVKIKLSNQEEKIHPGMTAMVDFYSN